MAKNSIAKQQQAHVQIFHNKIRSNTTTTKKEEKEEEKQYYRHHKKEIMITMKRIFIQHHRSFDLIADNRKSTVNQPIRQPDNDFFHKDYYLNPNNVSYEITQGLQPND